MRKKTKSMLDIKRKKSKKKSLKYKFSRFSRTKKMAVIFVISFAVVGSFFLIKSFALTLGESDAVQYNRTNATRAEKGIPSLGVSQCLTDKATAWAQEMARSTNLRHNNLGEYGNCEIGGSGWLKLGENVGIDHALGLTDSNSSSRIYEAYLNSPLHYNNIVDPAFNRIGLGSARGPDGKLYVAQAFANCGACSGPTWNVGSLTSKSPISSAGRLDVFARGTNNNHLWHRYFDGLVWKDWEDLGGSLSSGPTVSSWANGRLDVFARNSSGYLIHRYYDGSWHDWETFTDATIASDPDAVSWGANRIDIVARSESNKLMHKWYDGSWHNWETLASGNILSSPSISSWGSGRLDVFVRGTDSKVYHKFYDGGKWSSSTLEPLSGATYDSPDAVSWGPGRIDIAVKGTNGKVYQKFYQNGWSGWNPLDGGATSGPSVASRGSGRLDVFVRGTDNALHMRSYQNGIWGGWGSLGGTLTSAPDVVSWR